MRVVTLHRIVGPALLCLSCHVQADNISAPIYRRNAPGRGYEAPIQVRTELLLADAMAGAGAALDQTLLKAGLLECLVLVRDGTTTAFTSTIESWKGQVVFQDARIGYARVRIPIERWQDLRRHDAVDVVEIDAEEGEPYWAPPMTVAQLPPGTISAREPYPGERTELTAKQAVSLRDSARRALGLDTLQQRHPRFDGRGVTIAFVELEGTGAAIEHPAFGVARTLDGTTIAKVQDLVIPEPGWREVQMDRVVSLRRSATDSSLPAAPYDGEFKLGTAVRDAARGETYGVLWDQARGTVWVDANRNHTFADDPELKDARARPGDVGFLTRSQGRRSEPFRVTVDTGRGRITVHPARASEHVSMTAAVAAGADTPGNLAVGFAPAARVVLLSTNPDRVRRGGHGVLEAMITAAKEPSIDIITMSQTGSRPYPSVAGVARMVYERVRSRYRKAIVLLAGNSLAAEVEDSDGAVSVGAYLTADVAQQLYGVTSSPRGMILPYSVRGPYGDGALSPRFVAPIGTLGALGCYFDRRELENARFLPPPCYVIGGGTSAAAPAVAGVIAALLSGARQQGLAVTSADVVEALSATAQYIPDWSATAQGLGLPRADVAWHAIQQRQPAPLIRTASRSSHVLASYWNGFGRGIYEKERWRPGDRGTVELLLTRETGPKAGEYVVTWSGNSGAFKTAARVRLSRGETVRLPIDVVTAHEGVESAILNLVDPGSGLPVHRQMVTVVAATPFTEANGLVREFAGTAGPTDNIVIPLRVPEGTHALNIRLETDADALFIVREPAGWTYHRPTAVPATMPLWRKGVVTLSLPDPAAGVWMLTLGAWNPNKPPYSLKYSLRTSIQRLDVITESGERVPSAVAVKGSPDEPRDPLHLHVGSRRRFRVAPTAGLPTIASFDIQSGTDASQLVASARDTRTRFSMAVYDCADGRCRRVDAAVPAAATQRLRVDHPRRGQWKVAFICAPESRCGEIEWSQTRIDADPVQPTDSECPSIDSGPTRETTRVVPFMLRESPRRTSGSDDEQTVAVIDDERSHAKGMDVGVASGVSIPVPRGYGLSLSRVGIERQGVNGRCLPVAGGEEEPRRR